MDDHKIEGFSLDDIDDIGQSKDFDRLFRLTHDAAFSVALHQILISLHNENSDELTEQQMNLFLCMHLENSGQSCGILGCLQEWFPQYLNRFVGALREIEAIKSAEAIEKAISLLPEDGSWFFNTSNEAQEELMTKYDKEFSDYPDGNMPVLYRKYAEAHKAKIIVS